MVVIAPDPVSPAHAEVMIERLVRERSVQQAPVHVGEGDDTEVLVGEEPDER